MNKMRGAKVVRWNGQVSASERNEEVICIIGIFLSPLLFKWRCVDGRHAWVPMKQSWQKADGEKKKKKSPPSPHSVSQSLSLPLCSTERLIRTCHRSNEYHLNCFVYGSEFGCRFNLRMCLSSCARRGGRTESGSPNETPASVTGWRGPTRSDGFERKFWQGGGGRERHTHTHTNVQTE